MSCNCVQFFIFWISTAHEQKAHFVTSSIVTSQKRNLKIQMGQVVQFCIHSISQITYF